MINLENKEKACREVMLFIDALGEKYRNMVPKDVLQAIASHQDMNYHPEWEHTITRDSNARQMNFLHETITMIAWLNLEYWEQNEEKKKELREIYERNGRAAEMKQMP